jgi:hypothetical protein
MNIIASFILVLANFLMFSLDAQEVAVRDKFQTALEQVPVPDMSVSILDAGEQDQLVWLTEIYQFVENSLSIQTSGLTEQDLQKLEAHLSQVLDPVYIRILIDDFYKLDADFVESAVDKDGLDVKGNITADIGFLDVTTKGKYEVTLTVTDYASNKAEVTIVVKVE